MSLASLPWGSTYLAIRWAVEVTLPFLLASLHWGALLLSYTRWKGMPVPATGVDRRVIAVTSILSPVGTDGLVT